MEYCGPRGIPHSHFLGGPLAWTQDDRDKAVWWEIHRRESCPECGTRPDEWDPGKGGHDKAYVTELHRCWGCAEKAKAQDAIKDDKRPGLWVALTRNPEVRP